MDKTYFDDRLKKELILSQNYYVFLMYMHRVPVRESLLAAEEYSREFCNG